MPRFSLLLVALAAALSSAADTPPFNKAELEALLRKEHSTRISNIYDQENGIQYVARPFPTAHPWHEARRCTRLSDIRCAGTPGTSITRSYARASTGNAPSRSCRRIASQKALCSLTQRRQTRFRGVGPWGAQQASWLQ